MNVDEFVAKVYSFQWGALCFSFLGATLFLGFMDLPALFLITLLFNFIALFLSFCLPNLTHEEHRSIWNLPKMGVRGIFESPREVKFSFCCHTILTAILVTGYQIVQPYLNHLDMSPDKNGLIYFFGALVASMGSKIFAELSSKISYKGIFNICVLFLCISFLGLWLNGNNILVLALLFCAYRLSWGISTPLLVLLANKSLQRDDFRSTFFSLISLTSNMFTSCLLYIFGKLNLKIGDNYLVLAILLIVFSILLLWNWKDTRGDASKINSESAGT